MHHRSPNRPRGAAAGPQEPTDVLTLWPRRFRNRAAYAANYAGYIAVTAIGLILGFGLGVLAAPFLIVRAMLRGAL